MLEQRVVELVELWGRVELVELRGRVVVVGGGRRRRVLLRRRRGKKAFGESCADDAECASGRCFKGGTGGGAGDGGSGTASYCSIACTNKQQTDPVCQAQAGATGKCNSQGLCQKS